MSYNVIGGNDNGNINGNGEKAKDLKLLFYQLKEALEQYFQEKIEKKLNEVEKEVENIKRDVATFKVQYTILVTVGASVLSFIVKVIYDILSRR